VFTPRPFFEHCSQCVLNFTDKTNYYVHEFNHIVNESFFEQHKPTLSPQEQYDAWKANQSNLTTPAAIDVLLSKQTIPVLNESIPVAELKR
jgi:hypothetical protein